MIKNVCLLQHSPFRAPSKYRFFFFYEIKLKGTEEEKPMYSIYFRPGSDFRYISFFVFCRPIQISYIIQKRVHVHSKPFKKYQSAQNNAVGKISSLKRKKPFSQGVPSHVGLSEARPELKGGTMWVNFGLMFWITLIICQQCCLWMDLGTLRASVFSEIILFELKGGHHIGADSNVIFLIRFSPEKSRTVFYVYILNFQNCLTTQATQLWGWY